MKFFIDIANLIQISDVKQLGVLGWHEHRPSLTAKEEIKAEKDFFLAQMALNEVISTVQHDYPTNYHEQTSSIHLRFKWNHDR